MEFLNIVWILFLIATIIPMIQRRMVNAARFRIFRAIEEKRKSRVIALIHRQESVSVLGIPLALVAMAVELPRVNRTLRAFGHPTRGAYWARARRGLMTRMLPFGCALALASDPTVTASPSAATRSDCFSVASKRSRKGSSVYSQDRLAANFRADMAPKRSRERPVSGGQ